MMRDPFPEEGRYIVIAFLTSQLIIPCRANRFWYLGVCVNPVKRVLTARQRIEYPYMVKLARHSKVFRIARYRIKIREHFFYSAELGVQRALLLLIRQSIHAKPNQIGHLRHDIERLLVIAVEID